MKHLKSFNEDITSFSFEEELQDFCDNNLAYLLDDEDIEMKIIPSPNPKSKGWRVMILFDQPKKWDEIKDHMIPFLTRLIKQYQTDVWFNKDNNDVIIEVTRDLEAFINNWPHRKTTVYYQMKRLIEDDTKSGVIYSRQQNDIEVDDVLDSYITEFEIMVKGYKQEPKKGILTKIKSFFK